MASTNKSGTNKAVSNKSGVIRAGSAAFRKVLVNPLVRRKRDDVADLPHHDALAGDSINAIIEGDIIPRLMMAHAAGGGSSSGDDGAEIAPTDASRFADLPLELEAAGLLAEVDRFLAEGVSVEAIYLDLLAPAARRLGEMWESDECDFVDVTMGLWRLQEVMRDIAERSPAIVDATKPQRTILAAPMPGDQHSFGAMMLEEIFARAGWQSMAIPKPERRELLDVVAKRSFDVVGLTVTSACAPTAITSLITAIRSVSANPQVAILIGGNAVNLNPSMVAEVGADGTGADARAALELAEHIVAVEPIHAHAATSIQPPE